MQVFFANWGVNRAPAVAAHGLRDYIFATYFRGWLLIRIVLGR